MCFQVDFACILYPFGIHLGSTFLSKRRPGEVRKRERKWNRKRIPKVMDFEGLDPQNGCSRIDGVRFVQKWRVHENVWKWMKMRAEMTEKWSSAPHLSASFFDRFGKGILSGFGSQTGSKNFTCALSFWCHFGWFLPKDKKRGKRDQEGTAKGG